MTTSTTPIGADALLQLIESYVEKRHTHGAPQYNVMTPQYNVMTTQTHDTMLAALSAAQPAASAEPREVDMNEYRAMVAAMEQIDPATLPGLTAAQRCALGRFAKPAGGPAGDAPAQAAPRDSLHDCAVGDSNYAAGMLLGWNLCTDGRDEDFRRIREERLRAAASASKEAQEAAPAAQGEPVLSDAEVEQKWRELERADDSWSPFPWSLLAQWAFKRGLAARAAHQKGGAK